MVDVCGYAFEKVLVPPTYRDVVTCDTRAAVCLFVDPQCCVPAVCKTLPHCAITQAVVDVAQHYEDKWVFKCERISAEEAWKRWLREQIPSLDQVVLPHVFDIARADIEAMRLAAVPLPANVKSQISALLQPLVAAGKSRVSVNELTNVKIISESNTNADLYLRDGFGAITLYDLVVLKRGTFAQLTRNAGNFTLAQIQAGPPQPPAGATPAQRAALEAANKPLVDHIEALLVMIHELVHVRQYANLGLNGFLTNYLIETTLRGYGSDSFEREAYGFENTVAGTIGGTQLVELEAAKAAAKALGIGTAAVAQNPAQWAKVSAWLKRCSSGQVRDPATAKPVSAARCRDLGVREFQLQAVRAKFPPEVLAPHGVPVLKPKGIGPRPLPPRL
jgi:hypothetical protein